MNTTKQYPFTVISIVQPPTKTRSEVFGVLVAVAVAVDAAATCASVFSESRL